MDKISNNNILQGKVRTFFSSLCRSSWRRMSIVKVPPQVINQWTWDPSIPLDVSYTKSLVSALMEGSARFCSIHIMTYSNLSLLSFIVCFMVGPYNLSSEPLQLAVSKRHIRSKAKLSLRALTVSYGNFVFHCLFLQCISMFLHACTSQPLELLALCLCPQETDKTCTGSLYMIDVTTYELYWVIYINQFTQNLKLIRKDEQFLILLNCKTNSAKYSICSHSTAQFFCIQMTCHAVYPRWRDGIQAWCI